MMGHGDGRPGTPGPGGGGGGAGGGDTKATYSGGVVLVAIISFVLGTIAVAVPYWGLFRPQTGDTKLCYYNPPTIITATMQSHPSCFMSIVKPSPDPSHVYSDHEEGESRCSHLA